MSTGQRLSLLLGAGFIGLAGVILWLTLAPRLNVGPAPAAPAPTVTPAAVSAAALVNGVPLSQAEWRKTAALDQMMSTLAGRPAPNAEATLDRLINSQLVLQAAQAAGFAYQADDAAAQSRLQALQKSWNVADPQVDQTLAAAGLTRADLLAEVRELLRIEAYLQATANADQWLAAQRAQARISVLVGLNAAPSTALTAPPTPAPTLAPAEDVPGGVFEGQRAPDFALATTAGQTLKLSDLRGRPVAVNFWATWCPACRQELPALEAAYEKFGPQGVAVLGIDLREDAETVKTFAGQFGLSFPLLLDGDGLLSGEYRVLGIPTTVFIDTAGVVRARHVGPLTVEAFTDYVTPLLPTSGESPAAGTQPAAGIQPTVVPTAPATPTVAAAELAPAFSLPRENGAAVALADYRDKQNVVLVFYRGQT